MTVQKLVGCTPDDVLCIVEELRQFCQDEQVYALAFVAITPDQVNTNWAGAEAASMELVGGLTYAAHTLIEDSWT